MAWLHLSLLTGLAPVLAAGGGLIETVGLLAVFRVSLAGRAAWRKLLPAVVAAACVLYGCWSFAQSREQYLGQHGPPRHYYAW